MFADVVLLNGKVVTMDERESLAEAIAKSCSTVWSVWKPSVKS